MNRLRRGADDDGLAMVMVIVLGMVMVLLVGTGLGVVSSGLRLSDTDQDTTGANDAAYAGVQDYVARLNADPSYARYGAATSPFTVAAGSAATVVADTGNNAFGLGTGGTWAAVPGSGGTSTYRYEVDNSQYGAYRVVNLRVTGRVGAVTRTLVASVRQRQFLDFVYFTDYEVQDPNISGNPACAVYAWAAARSSGCTIQFAPGDSIGGPVHSNDTLTVCGTTFSGAVTTSNPGTPIVNTPAGCRSGTYQTGTGPTYSAMLGMPASNSTMAATAATSGCLYTGPTQITYGADGTMTVRSPWTKRTQPSSTTSTTPAKCGSIADLQSPGGATVGTLNDGLLYVQDVPIDPANVNYSATTNAALPPGFTCLDSTSAAMSGSASSAGWRFGTARYPRANEVPTTGWESSSSTAAWDTVSPAYGCRAGDLFVSGTVDGVTTAAAANYIYITGDVVYEDDATDLLGLVGDNAILVYNPMSKSVLGAYSSLLGDSGRRINASLLSVGRTFQVQNYDRGAARGTLTVFGSIAQKYRGPVGISGGSGYVKDYDYDPRLKTTMPPYFLVPATVSFGVGRYAQTARAFSSTGAAL